MPTPYRQCCYINESGLQCEVWFEANESKLCPEHNGILSPLREETKVKYIDLANSERATCYQFVDGSQEPITYKLIYEYTTDSEGSSFEKLDRHIAFIERVLEDVKTRNFSARATKKEKLDQLSESERDERRKIVIDREVRKKVEKIPSIKADPIKHLMKSRGLSAEAATELMSMDDDALLAKFLAKKKEKENSSNV